MAGPAERHGELVHQPALDADVGVLGPLRRLGQGHRVRCRPVAAGQRPGRRELEGGRRRQAGARRQVGGEQATEAAGREAGLGHRPGRAGHVVDPATAPVRADGVEVEPVD